MSLIVVDIQPEYENAFDFSIHEFCAFLQEMYESNVPILILYNGHDTLDMVTETDLKNWYYDHGFEDAYWVEYYDKGYGFFRYCMDEDADESDLIRLLRFMYEREIWDSRELAEEDWDDFIAMFEDESVDYIREMLEFSDDMINIPDLMDELLTWQKKHPGDIKICGGGVHECLAEVQIALGANKQDYSVISEYTY